LEEREMPLRKHTEEEILLANVLGACLDALDAGGNPEEVLAQYPEQADDVEPVLDIALMLREARDPAMYEIDASRFHMRNREELRLHSRTA
jgi:hypothetical protein